MKVAITGAKGVVGTALSKGLEGEYTIVPIDLPEVDLRDEEQARHAIKGADAVIHLAGIFGPAKLRGENWRSPFLNPDNLRMTRNMIRSGRDMNIKKLIIASSIHVEDTHGWHGPDLLKPDKFYTNPVSAYGKSKRLQEKWLARHADEFSGGVAAIRLGGVTPNNLPLQQHSSDSVLKHEQSVFLSHEDLVNAVSTILELPEVPGHFTAFYAVSNNPGRFHDTSNPLGWQPINH